MIILINFIGLSCIAFVIYWFWLATAKAKHTPIQGSATIVVENGVYNPDTLTAKAGLPLELTFIRKDDSTCAEVVLFPTWDISQQLPLKQAQTITITPKQTGTYEFTCQMGMYRGQLIVVEEEES